MKNIPIVGVDTIGKGITNSLSKSYFSVQLIDID
tara:strand:+ start:475 stop:576 length:102 start_codon:yes stop_codon:yes gene_type:complete